MHSQARQMDHQLQPNITEAEVNVDVQQCGSNGAIAVYTTTCQSLSL